MATVLRPATMEDVGTYIRISKRIASPINLVITNPNEVLRAIWLSHVFIIELDGEDIGFISYEFEKDRRIYISEFAVHPDFQNRHVGSNVLRSIVERFESDAFDIKAIYLVTHPKNPAKRLYERHGFKETGFIENFDKSGTLRLILTRTISRV